ncbi:MAG TPA: alpha/beta-type small acid-soluble spore protein [Symbiobacteriaceae bacterium]|nr:alpha/beta-type small acid-soluble spore protein [Symbiobacteriaceae bacterium]
MPSNNNNNRPLVSAAAGALDQLKFEVAQDLGVNVSNLQDLQQRLDERKYEIASELNIPFQHGYNGQLTSREAGKVGGRLGGHLGGQMVKRMIAQAEQALSNQQK